MSGSPAMHRGRPVFVLTVILSAWIGGRAMLWEPDLAFSPRNLDPPEGMAVNLPTADVPGLKNPVAPKHVQTNEPRTLTVPARPSVMKPAPWMPRSEIAKPASYHIPASHSAAGAMRPSQFIAGHATLLRSGLARTSRLLETRNGADERPAARPVPSFVPRASGLAQKQIAPASRYSADVWGLWREGSGSSAIPGTPSLGRSQAGAIGRYALAPASPYAPELHLRASTALEGARENDVALGISARPLSAIPVRLAVEGRLTDTSNGARLRAGAYLVSEIAPLDLPAKTRGEIYLQGGYVTGRDDTAFIDGHVRVTRELAALADFRLSAGGGGWGGAQEGIERLDIGPTAGVSFPVGDGFARIAADYRLRIAGRAAPDSGPALTLAAGF